MNNIPNDISSEEDEPMTHENAEFIPIGENCDSNVKTLSLKGKNSFTFYTTKDERPKNMRRYLITVTLGPKNQRKVALGQVDEKTDLQQPYGTRKSVYRMQEITATETENKKSVPMHFRMVISNKVTKGARKGHIVGSKVTSNWMKSKQRNVKARDFMPGLNIMTNRHVHHSQQLTVEQRQTIARELYRTQAEARNKRREKRWAAMGL
jgi:hypothetical protein